MLHLNERFAFWPRTRIEVTPPFGAVSMRDFYRHGGMRFGHVHAMGLPADYGSILNFLRSRFDASLLLAPVRPLRPLLRIPAKAAQALFGKAHMFVGLLEDMPDPENRVILDPARPRLIRYQYATGPELRARRRAVPRVDPATVRASPDCLP